MALFLIKVTAENVERHRNPDDFLSNYVELFKVMLSGL